MTKTALGLICIAGGCAYGSLASKRVNDLVIGNLARHGFIKQATMDEAKKIKPTSLGNQGTILAYSIGLVALGTYLLINPSL